MEPVPTFSTCYSAPFLTLQVCIFRSTLVDELRKLISGLKQPTRYGKMLEERIREHGTSCWLVNTGWVGGKYGIGSRISLKHTRAIIDAIHSGALCSSPFPPSSDSPNISDHHVSPSSLIPSQAHTYGVQWTQYPTFGLYIPTAVPGVPDEILDPSQAWVDADAFDRERVKLASLFRRAFRMFERDVDESIRDAGPVL